MATRDRPFFTAATCSERVFATGVRFDDVCLAAARALGLPEADALRAVVGAADKYATGNASGHCIVTASPAHVVFVADADVPPDAQRVCQMVYGCSEDDWRKNR